MHLQDTALSELDKMVNYKHILHSIFNSLEPVSIEFSGVWKCVTPLVHV